MRLFERIESRLIVVVTSTQNAHSAGCQVARLGTKMAVGTRSGLLDSSDHAQSILKLAIIKRYVLPFFAMTGSTSDQGRVVVMDGFAGRGRYEDGLPGSAELIMQAIERLRGSRTVSAFFAETDAGNYQNLKAVVDEYVACGVAASALPVSAEEQLDTVIAAAAGVPLFLLLDPCGALLPFARLANVLGARRQSVRPPTEALLNFSADFTRRASGQLAAGRTQQAGIARMDVTCGGRWWRDTAMDAHLASSGGTFQSAADAVVGEYAARLARSARMLQVTVPVRRRLHHQPVYHLVFLTRSQYGIWVFANALGKARQDWLRAIGRLDDDADDQDTLPGMSRSDDMRQLIGSEQRRAQDLIEANLRNLIRAGPFKLVDQVKQVFGEAYGIATDTSVAAAVRALAARSELVTLRSASHIRDTVISPY
jgi:three-Cys-motif partner protein